MGQTAGGRGNRLLVEAARAPHVGKAGLAVLGVTLLGIAAAERMGMISLVPAGFLAFAALTGTLFLLCLYDLVVSVLELQYRPSRSGLQDRFRITSDVVQEYVRWLSPLGFVVGIIFGHYFWQ